MSTSKETTINIRPSEKRDISAVHSLLPSLEPLTPHTWYTYWNLFTHFPDSCFIAENQETPIGFITSHLTETPPSEWFIWQAGILPDYRGSGLIDRLQDRVIDVAREAGARALRTTIEADNPRSFEAFNRMATRLGTTMVELERFNVPFEDTSSVPEVLYRISLKG